MIIPISEPQRDIQVAFNIGAGIGSDNNPVIARPEIGVLATPGEGGLFWAAGLGLTFKLTQ